MKCTAAWPSNKPSRSCTAAWRCRRRRCSCRAAATTAAGYRQAHSCWNDLEERHNQGEKETTPANDRPKHSVGSASPKSGRLKPLLALCLVFGNHESSDCHTNDIHDDGEIRGVRHLLVVNSLVMRTLVVVVVPRCDDLR